VIQEAYVGGVSTRRVEELVTALGISSLSKSEVSRICGALDAEVEAFRSRPLDPEGHPYLFLDALYHKVREGGRGGEHGHAGGGGGLRLGGAQHARRGGRGGGR